MERGTISKLELDGSREISAMILKLKKEFKYYTKNGHIKATSSMD